MPSKKIFIMATRKDCPFCAAMKPVYESLVKEYSGLKDLDFALYDVDSDDWKLADDFGIEGVPGFVICNDDASVVYEVNNEGLVDKQKLVTMLINNHGKK